MELKTCVDDIYEELVGCVPLLWLEVLFFRMVMHSRSLLVRSCGSGSGHTNITFDVCVACVLPFMGLSRHRVLYSLFELT
jgi:hypothetical protein